MASEPFVDSTPASRIVDRLDRFGNFLSSESLVLDGLWLVRGEGSLSVFEDFDLGVSARTVLLLDLFPSSFLDRRLEDDLLTSARILMFAFFALAFSLSEPFSLSSCSSTGVPLRDEGGSTPVNGGLGGAW